MNTLLRTWIQLKYFRYNIHLDNKKIANDRLVSFLTKHNPTVIPDFNIFRIRSRGGCSCCCCYCCCCCSCCGPAPAPVRPPVHLGPGGRSRPSPNKRCLRGKVRIKTIVTWKLIILLFLFSQIFNISLLTFSYARLVEEFELSGLEGLAETTARGLGTFINLPAFSSLVGALEYLK